ncbi:MAG: riboflavin synthase [Helicobacter sp.]|nr:riboflavin synthase [Helicobacter sp.]
MFTGLVRELGEVQSLKGAKLTIKAKHKAKLGDSIAVNGACLTAIEILQNGFVLELSEETQKQVVLESYKGLVHIEPALSLGERLDGHLVQGHIDGVGKIVDIKKHKVGTDFFIKVDSNTLKFCTPKGSIAINGISLTINEVLDFSIRLTIIPHTLKNTLFNAYKIGDRVNIETDCLARMVWHFMQKKPISKLSWSEVDSILGGY